MSSSQAVDLSTYHPGAVEPLPRATDLSRFKEPMQGRVIAASFKHIVYTLKDPSKIRVVQAAVSGTAASFAFERHTAPVRKIEFMSPKSNIVASISDKELLVWIITEPSPVVSLVFTAASVATFCWTQPEAPTMPWNIAATTKDNELLAIPASRLLQENMQDENGTVRTVPRGEITIAKEQCRVIAKDVKVDADSGKSILVEAFPALIASVDASSAFLCRDDLITRWKPAGDNTPLVGISVLHQPRPNTVVIATASTISFWDVSLDAPMKLLHVDVPLTILKLECNANRVILVLGNSADAVRTKIQFATVQMTQKNRQGQQSLEVNRMALHEVDLEVPFESSACVITPNERGDDPWVILDLGRTITVHTLPSRINRPPPATAPQQQPLSFAGAVGGPGGAGGMLPGMVPPPSYGAAGPGLPGLQLAPGLGPALSGLPLNGMAKPFLGGGGLAGGAGSNGVAATASAVAASSAEDFDRSLEPYVARLNANAARVRNKALDLTAVLPVDHEALLAQALDSQRDTILNFVRTAVSKELEQFRGKLASSSAAAAAASQSRAPPVVQLDEETSAQISEIVIRGVSDSVVESVARGIADSLNVQLARRVEGLVQATVQRNVKRLRKQQEKEGNRGAETVAVEVLAAAKDEMDKKQKDYGMQLLYQLQQLNLPATQTLQKMQKTIEAQQRFIDKFTNSGLLEEVQRLRDEVANLRAAGTAQVAPPSKTSILARARDALVAGDVDNGLQWVLQQNDPALTLALVAGVEPDRLEEMVEGAIDVPAARWERVATDLASVVDPQHLPAVLRILQELIASTRLNLVKNPKVVSVLRSYVDTWKRSNDQLPADIRNTLRELAVELR